MKTAYILALLTASLLSCKETTVSDQTPRGRPLKSHVEFDADNESEVSSNANFFFVIWNQSFSTDISSLPTAASVDAAHIPYSDTWYPQKLGGTNARNGQAQSPLEKYDHVYHPGKTLAADWEAQNHTVDPSSAQAGWTGHCNGFSAAAQRHSPPKNAVTKGDTTFTPQDIKALLAEIHMSAKYLFLGGNRCDNESYKPVLPGQRPDPTTLGQCDGVNAGTFHLTLANWIGKLKHTIIFDEYPGYEVWNYPIYKYTSQLTSISRDTAISQVKGSSGSSYPFNPKATKFMSVATTITISDAAYPSAGSTNVPVNRSYTYVLELNDQGQVIGGEWTGDSQNTRPEFLWVAFEPVIANGNAAFGNPNLDPTEVIKLWAQSIGADANNPPLDIMEPVVNTGWGKFNLWSVTMDGQTSGTAFLGKKTHFDIARRDALTGDASAEILLNGQSGGSVTVSGSDDLQFDLSPAPGLNELVVTFKKSGSVVDTQTLDFHAIP